MKMVKHMQMNEQDYRDMVGRFTAFLEHRRLKKTPERYAILARVMHLPPHFEAEDVRRALDDAGFHVSRATVYSTMDLLCECGLLRRLLLDARQARYELASSNHVHLVCTRCGSVAEADGKCLGLLARSLDTGGFRASYYSMSVYGLCAGCIAETEGSSSSSPGKVSPELNQTDNNQQ